MKNNQKILILDFGGQYSQLIARRIRELNVYCEIVPYNISAEEIKNINPKGLVFTGGPASVLELDAPFCKKNVIELGIPILGICYGMQLLGVMLGGKVEKCDSREYGKVDIRIDTSSKLTKEVAKDTTCWMSHTYYVSTLPKGFKNISKTDNCANAAIENSERNIYGVQFHPEVVHTPEGKKMLKNFLYDICGCIGDWKMSSFVSDAIADIKQKIGAKKVICALSGGVDSMVAAVIVNKAIGEQLTCIFVNHGLLRKNEVEQVKETIKARYNINIIVVDAKQRFLDRLIGICDPEEKRKIIGAEFIKVFEEQAKKIGNVKFLVQGTIYPDVIESGLGNAAVIKSHHNVGGLPEKMEFESIIEPLRSLFKDEVRTAGLELGIPEHMIYRQPFPGPGLAVRIIGEITEQKLKIVGDADYILRDEVNKAGIDRDINQYFTVLTDMKSVGVMGDERTYDYVVAVRAVVTTDFMTAEWARLPYELLERVSNRIVNEVKYVNRVVYDITSKPPATIEWE